MRNYRRDIGIAAIVDGGRNGFREDERVDGRPMNPMKPYVMIILIYQYLCKFYVLLISLITKKLFEFMNH